MYTAKDCDENIIKVGDEIICLSLFPNVHGRIEKIEIDDYDDGCSIVYFRCKMNFYYYEYAYNLMLTTKLIANKCDCGAEKANTTHADWCSSVVNA